MINIENLYQQYGKDNVKLNHFDSNIFPFFVTYIPYLELYIDDLSDLKNGDKPYDQENDLDVLELKRLKSLETLENNDYLKLTYWGKINRLKLEYVEANKLNYIAYYKDMKVEYCRGKRINE